jgi:hypothetical protein
MLAALAVEFGAHHPGDLEGPFALRSVGPREDSLLLVIAEPHRSRVLRCLLGRPGDGPPSAPALEQTGSRGPWLVLGPRGAGGTVLIPKDHGPALRLAQQELTARQAARPGGGSWPAWSGSPAGRTAASTVLRRIRLFADDAVVDFRTSLPGEAVLAGPYPDLLESAARPSVMAVCNSTGGHGCSSLAAALAQALGREGHRVLYVATQRGLPSGPGLYGGDWPAADAGLATVSRDPARHVEQLPSLAHAFVRCSSPGADGPDQARQLANLLRHPFLDAAFSHVVIDASATGLPHAAARTADLTIVPWRRVPRPPGRQGTDVHLTPLGEIWAWLDETYREVQRMPRLEDYYAHAERLAQFARTHGTDTPDHPLEDVLERQMFLHDTETAGARRWGAQWTAARDGWISHLLREQTSDTRWDDAAGTRVLRTLSAQEWSAALRNKITAAAHEVLCDLPAASRRRRPWLVPTVRIRADALHAVREACAQTGLQVSSTVLPDIGDATRPASRARWEEAVHQLVGEVGRSRPLEWCIDGHSVISF